MDHLRALRILGLPPGASAADIQTAWRDLAKVWHPDRFAHDERLRTKAGENLSRINQAHEALADYDPAAVPTVAARMRQSVAIILGMGELGEPPEVPAEIPAPEPALVPRGPIGIRHTLQVLGLGPPTRRRSHRRRRIVLLLLLLLIVAAAYLARR